MKYGVFGINRVAKDFLFIFDELNILYIFDGGDFDCFEGIPVVNQSEIRNYLNQKKIDKLIVCDFDKQEKHNYLEGLGLKYGVDYIDEKDLFQTFDTYSLNREKKPMVVWGCGRRVQKMSAFYGIDSISFFIDSSKSGTCYSNTDKWIYHPNEVELNKYFIVISISNNKEIIQELENKGLNRYDDFCTMGELLTQPSWMLEKTIFEKNSYNVECQTLFNHMELSQQGIINCCCVPFVIGEMGSIENSSLSDIWNGIVHKIMCLASNNRTFSFCNPDLCPMFIERDKNTSFDLNRPYSKMEKYPRNLLVNFEDSCNLFCESCREKIKIASGRELETNLRYADILISEVLPHTEFITMAGTGEVFVGKGYERLYTSEAMKNVKWIRLLTNGLLFNEKNWKRLKGDYEDNRKFILTVSIDAATKNTYEELRRGGSFDILKKNMEFASELRKEGRLSYFRLNFVVQRKNFKEMPLFVEWGLDLGVDEVFFTKILNFGTYGQQDFLENVSMMEEDGITPKKELMDIIDLPIMKESIVDLGTIRYAHEAIGVDKIENYYRWELERKVPGLFTNK